MKIKIIVHKAEERGFWAEVPAIPGCVSQAETLDELDDNIGEAIVGCLSVDPEVSSDGFERELDIAV